MAIRLRVWLAAMASATLLLAALVLLATLLQSWLVAGTIVLALFAPLAWLLARLAFHPVRDVTKTARSITTTGELDRRCFYRGPRDDVGDLVVAVNELLVRYDLAIGRIRRLQAAQPDCDCPRDPALPDAADLVLDLRLPAEAAAVKPDHPGTATGSYAPAGARPGF